MSVSPTFSQINVMGGSGNSEPKLGAGRGKAIGAMGTAALAPTAGCGAAGAGAGAHGGQHTDRLGCWPAEIISLPGNAGKADPKGEWDFFD